MILAEGVRFACTDALRRVGALDLAGCRYAELSGGERQRVLVARALAQQAGHLLFDEPTNHLAVRYQHEVLALVRGLAREGAAVVVLHVLNLAAGYCDDLVLLGTGRWRPPAPSTRCCSRSTGCGCGAWTWAAASAWTSGRGEYAGAVCIVTVRRCVPWQGLQLWRSRKVPGSALSVWFSLS